MNRSELITLLSQRNKISHSKAEKIVALLMEEMIATLAAGQRIEIRGFGTFDLSCRPPRYARNPKTGEIFFMESKYFPMFKPGKRLKTSLVQRSENNLD